MKDLLIEVFIRTILSSKENTFIMIRVIKENEQKFLKLLHEYDIEERNND